MSLDQAIALIVLIGVVVGLIWGRLRSDVVALTGAAILLATGTIRPSEVQGAFASPAILALASLFIIAHALELSGALGWLIQRGVGLSRRFGVLGVWGVIGACGAASAFLNNTPIVVLAAPVVRDMARTLGVSGRRFLLPLSYVTILGGACTLIGTSTNLLVNDMARNAGQPAFTIFEIAPVGLIAAGVGAVYLLLAGGRLSAIGDRASVPKPVEPSMDEVGRAEPEASPLKLRDALTAAAVFAAVVTVAALGYAPIAAAAFTGAVVLILLRVLTADEAYRGLRPDVLLLIAGMVVVGSALQVTGLAASATEVLVRSVSGLSPILALALLYFLTSALTELLSNAAVAVLVTPVAVALATSLGVNPRPFLIGVMMAASSSFATPFGYQTNVIVFRMGPYAYMDFVRVGLPLNVVTGVAVVTAAPFFFPF